MKPKFNIQKKGEQKMANVIILAHFKDRNDIADIIPVCAHVMRCTTKVCQISWRCLKKKVR